MAIYIPGVKDYIPQVKTFTPDYKFLSNVLDKRQDRYDTNYQQLNNIYGKVVYADLSRADTQAKRDQYSKDLVPKLKQISGLDLSLGQNVDAAKALFKPFWDDEQIVRDLVMTKHSKDQMQLAQDYETSPDRDIRQKYWDVGVKGLQYQMEDFVNATPEKAMSMNLPKYVENPNLFKEAKSVLDESGIEITDVINNGMWDVKLKNGALITHSYQGQDSEGKPIYKDIGKDYAAAMLLDDPNVKKGYWMKAYVEAREFGKANAEQYGGEEQARQAWANNKIQNLHQKQKKKLVTINNEVEYSTSSVNNWKQYAEKYGIIPESEEDKRYLTAAAKLDMLQTIKKQQVNALAVQSEQAVDEEQLLNRAYNSIMLNDINTDLTRASLAYSMETAERDIELNQLELEKWKWQNRVNLETWKQNSTLQLEQWKRNNKMSDDDDDRQFQLDKIILEAKLEGNASGDGIPRGKVRVKDNEKGAAHLTINNDGETVDFVQINKNDIEAYNNTINEDQWTAVQSYYTHKDIKHVPTTLTYKMGGKSVTKNWGEAKVDLMKTENQSELDSLYNKVVSEVANSKESFPGNTQQAAHMTQLKATISTVNATADLLDLAIKGEKESMSHLQEDVFKHESGASMKKNHEENGTPSVLMSDYEMWEYERSAQEKTPLAGKRVIASQREIWELGNENPQFHSNRGLTQEQGYENHYNSISKSKTQKMVSKDDYIETYVNWTKGLAGTRVDDYGVIFKGPGTWNSDAQKYHTWHQDYYGEGDGQAFVRGRYPKGEPYWKYDEAAAREDAAEIYDNEYEAYNKYLGETAPGDTEGDTRWFSVRHNMAGTPQRGVGVGVDKTYGFSYDHERKDPNTVRQIEEIFKIYDGAPSGSIQINMGDTRGDMQKVDTDSYDASRSVYQNNHMVAGQVMDAVLNDLSKTYGKNDEKTGKPQMDIDYSPHAFTEEDGTEWAAYNFTLNPKYAEKFRSSSNSNTNRLMKNNENTSNEFTLFVKKEFDNNPYKPSNQTQSIADMEIQKNGKLERNQYPGGGIKMWKNSNGQIMEQRYSYGFNVKTNSFEQDFQSPRILTIEGAAISKNQMDGYLANIETQNSRMAEFNNDLLKKQKIALGVVK